MWNEASLGLRGHIRIGNRAAWDLAEGSEGHSNLRTRTGDTDGTGRRQQCGAGPV